MALDRGFGFSVARYVRSRAEEVVQTVTCIFTFRKSRLKTR